METAERVKMGAEKLVNVQTMVKYLLYLQRWTIFLYSSCLFFTSDTQMLKVIAVPNSQCSILFWFF